MKDKYRNIFMLFGIAAILIMVFTFDVDMPELLSNLKRAGYMLPLIILLWVVIYFVNALSWYVIINDKQEERKVSFALIYKLTISGFALNYATPMGLMGGEPYRIMELSPHIGTSRATSSVILYVMMHIFSHLCFWLSSIVLYIAYYPVNSATGTVFAIAGVAISFLIYMFMKGYRYGLTVKTLRMCSRLPFLGKKAHSFMQKQEETLMRIDRQIGQLHSQRKTTFYVSLLLEYAARIIGCLEIYMIMNVLTSDVSFVACVLIMAFSSLFANLLFFSPMQLGAREGGLAIAVSNLGITSAYGVYAGLITRVRELVWITIGVALMKCGNNRTSSQNNTKEDKQWIQQR